MHTDKDANGNISIMEIPAEDAGDLATIFREFEYLIRKSSLSDREQGRLTLLSAKMRFQLIDVMK
jgi:hypothetical protein